MSRLRGRALQEAFERTKAEALAVPAHLCMMCQRPGELHKMTAVFGDVATEMETGHLEINGEVELRICRSCYALIEASHRASGLPIRKSRGTQ